MGTFAVQTRINAPVEAVWQALADIGRIDQWNPGVIQSYTLSELQQGMGAARYCDLGGDNFLEEEVVAWEPGERLTMRVMGTNMPLRSADIHFYLASEDGRTRVTLSPQYALKYGPLGMLLDRFYVRGVYQKGMRSLLRGLKAHVEAQPAGAGV